MRSNTGRRRWCARPEDCGTRSPSSTRAAAPAMVSCSRNIAPRPWSRHWREHATCSAIARDGSGWWTTASPPTSRGRSRRAIICDGSTTCAARARPKRAMPVKPQPGPILVYADGSCEGNPGPGGWGVVIVSPEGKHRLNGGDSRTTNNRMEIMAAIEALRALDPGIPVILRSDSQYLVKTVNDGWRRTKNQDLWKELDAEIARHEVRFEWVRGHAGDSLNEEADALAREGARNAALGRAPGTLA